MLPSLLATRSRSAADGQAAKTGAGPVRRSRTDHDRQPQGNSSPFSCSSDSERSETRCLTPLRAIFTSTFR